MGRHGGGDGHRVIGVALPGHIGDSGPASQDPADVVLRHCLSVGHQVDAVGFSAGGYAVLHAAARCPEAFRRIAVLGVGDSTESYGGPLRAAVIDALEADDEPVEGLARTIRRLVVGTGNDRFAVAGFLRRDDPPLSAAQLAAITPPILLVLGEHDFARSVAGLVAALPTATSVMLPGTDHFATPTNFHAVDAVLRFLSE